MIEKQTDSQTGSLGRLHDLIVSFQPEWDHGDENWEFRFPVGRKWHYLWAKRYRNCLYLGGTHIDQVIEMTDFKTPEYNVLDAAGLTVAYCTAIEAVLNAVRKDPLAYHRGLMRALPPAFRRGVIHRTFVHLLMPGYMRYDQELKPAALNAMTEMLKTPHRGEPLPGMTSGTFFKYCRVAYLANPESHPIDEKRDADGREMYLKWADGRDEGLAALPLDDAAVFDAGRQTPGITIKRASVVIRGKFTGAAILPTSIWRWSRMSTAKDGTSNTDGTNSPKSSTSQTASIFPGSRMTTGKASVPCGKYGNWSPGFPLIRCSLKGTP